VAPIITGIILHFRFHIRFIFIHINSCILASSLLPFALHFCLQVLPHYYYCYYYYYYYHYSNIILAAQVYVMSSSNKCCLNCTKSQDLCDHVMKYYTFQNKFTKTTSTLSVFILNKQNGQ
jgi:hypothetical protein